MYVAKVVYEFLILLPLPLSTGGVCAIILRVCAKKKKKQKPTSNSILHTKARNYLEGRACWREESLLVYICI